MPEPADFDVFLSFKGAPTGPADTPGADTNSNRIADLMKHELGQNLAIKTFHFKHDVAPGAEFLQVITDTIKSAKSVIILLSNAYVDVGSHFCRHELSITREVKEKNEQSIFSTDPAFVPSRHSTILAGVSAPDISDWQGGLGNPFVKSAAVMIAEAIGRPVLSELIDILVESDPVSRDDRIMDWSFRTPDDRASKLWRARLAGRLWSTRNLSNQEKKKSLKTIVERAKLDFDSELNVERAFLEKLEQAATQGTLTREDWRALNSRPEADLSHHFSGTASSPEKVRKLEEEAEALNSKLSEANENLENVNRRLLYIEREHEVQKQETSKYKKLNEEAQRELAQLRDPKNGQLEALLSAIRDQSVAASESNLRTAWKYRESAQRFGADSEALMGIIDQLIKSDGSRRPIVADQYQIHHFPSEPDAPGQYCGRLSLKSPPARGIHKRRVYGHFDQWPVFKGLGVIQFAEGQDVVAWYMGELDGLFPKTGGYGVYKFTARPHVQVREWEGSVSPNSAIGRLVRDDGSVFWGPVLLAGFGMFHEHGFGVLERSRKMGGDQSVIAGEWRNGHAV